MNDNIKLILMVPFIVTAFFVGLWVGAREEPQIWDTQEEAYSAGVQYGLQAQIIK